MHAFLHREVVLVACHGQFEAHHFSCHESYFCRESCAFELFARIHYAHVDTHRVLQLRRWAKRISHLNVSPKNVPSDTHEKVPTSGFLERRGKQKRLTESANCRTCIYRFNVCVCVCFPVHTGDSPSDQGET